MRKSLQEFCAQSGMTYLLDQWDQEKNMDISPATISCGSAKKVWWRCEKGHAWQAEPYKRTKGTNCPVCANRVIQPGFNDLGTVCPELLSQWHTEKNGDLSPNQVFAGSNKKVWWRCEQGHEWQAKINSRASGTQCPICTNRVINAGENDLETTHPELAEQWHPKKNDPLTPQTVFAGSAIKVWWRCEKGHEWQAKINSRTGLGSGCPVCAGVVIIPSENDLATLSPDIAREWHPSKNGVLKPDMVAPSCNRKVWWRCQLGHEWQAKINSRTGLESGCPYCAGRKVLPGFNDLATRHPDVAAQWHATLNGSLTAQMVTQGSHKKVWWECANGHVWKAVVYSRTGARQHGCPVCAGTVREDRQQRYVEAETARQQK